MCSITKQQILYTVRVSFFLLIGFSRTVTAQDPVSDLRELGRMYASATSMSMKVEFKVNSSVGNTGSSSAPVKGWMKWNGRNFISFMGGKTTLSNEHCSMMLLQDQKMILYNRPLSLTDKGAKPGADIIDSAFFAGKKITYLPSPEGQKKIEITFAEKSKSPYDKMEVTYIPKKELTEVVYYYKPGAMGTEGPSSSIIKYSDVIFNGAIAETDFSESTYIRKKGKVVEPQDAYKNYKVVDQRISKR
jgi:hypothetical protein